jgi:uncharacterized membrane protein
MDLQTSSSQNPAPALSESIADKRTWLVSMTSLVFIVLQSASALGIELCAHAANEQARERIVTISFVPLAPK